MAIFKIVFHFFTVCSSSSSICFKKSIEIIRQSLGNTVKVAVVGEREKNTSRHQICIRVRRVNAVLLPKHFDSVLSDTKQILPRSSRKFTVPGIGSSDGSSMVMKFDAKPKDAFYSNEGLIC